LPQCLNRRRAKAREAAALAAREVVLDRLAWQIAELRANLDKMAVANAAMAAVMMVMMTMTNHRRRLMPRPFAQQPFGGRGLLLSSLSGLFLNDLIELGPIGRHRHRLGFFRCRGLFLVLLSDADFESNPKGRNYKRKASAKPSENLTLL
jgi:hypothetical protein